MYNSPALPCPLSHPSLKQDRAGAREVVLAWMSLMCQLNEDRTLLGEARKLLNPTHLMTGGLPA